MPNFTNQVYAKIEFFLGGGGSKAYFMLILIYITVLQNGHGLLRFYEQHMYNANFQSNEEYFRRPPPKTPKQILDLQNVIR